MKVSSESIHNIIFKYKLLSTSVYLNYYTQV